MTRSSAVTRNLAHTIQRYCSHPLARYIPYGLSLLIYIGSIIPGEYTPAPTVNDKLLHLLGFSALMASFRLTHPRPADLNLALAVFGFGVFIEITQWFIPYRSFSIADMIADAAGILLATILCKVILRLQLETPNIHH